jgi:hypothetical protein
LAQGAKAAVVIKKLAPFSAGSLFK